MTIRVLFVSTGDVCRAPMAVGCLRALVQRARRTDDCDIDSAGTYEGATGQPPSLLAQEVAARRGYPIRDLRARRLEPADLADIDYALAMDRTQLAAMRIIAPGPLTERPQMLLSFAPVLGIREIRDPFGGTTQDYEKALDLIECACTGLLEHIGMAMAGDRVAGLAGGDNAATARPAVESARIIDLQKMRRLR